MTDLRAALQASLGTAYTLDRELGAGGMSRVFVAEEAAFRRQVVVKVLPPEMAADVSLDRFRREIQLAGRLQHPHIVPVLSTGMVGDLPYFTMPFVDGESLRAKLARDGKPPLAEGVRIIREVADALAYAHEQGIVHRDIKPDNILLTRQHAVVTDFGVAKALDAAGARDPTLTGLGMALGTPAYMSPEQATGDPTVDHRADIYSLGVVAYEVLCGTPPFSGRSVHAIIAAHIADIPEPVGTRCATLPPALSALVMRMLAKDPAARPQSAADVLRELETISVADEGSGKRRVAVRRALALSAAAICVAAGVIGGRRWLAHRASASEAALAEKSIAVLPFENMSAAKDDEYFSDGMTEEVSNELANVGGLHVAARTSAYAFKGKHLDAIDIARDLRVHNLVEGTVRRDGNRVRITAELINGHDGYRLWNAAYEDDVRDVFKLQQAIAREIATALELRLSSRSPQQIAAKPTSVDAHDLYLKGRFFWSSRDGAAMPKAIKYFQDALRLDSTYALPYAGLADAYALLATFGDGNPRDVMPRAREAAEHALALDSTLAEAQTSLGIVNIFYDWDWTAAEQHLTKAIALNPDYATARLFHAWSLFLTNRGDSALAELRRAQALEPLSLILGTRVASGLYYLHRYPEAEEQLRKVFDVDSTYLIARIQRAELLAEEGHLADAVSAFPPFAVVETRSTGDVGVLGNLYGRAGRAREARALIDTMIAHRTRRYIPAVAIVEAYVGLGDHDAAFHWIDRAVDERNFETVLMRLDPEMVPLHGDPRWAPFVRRLGLTP